MTKVNPIMLRESIEVNGEDDGKLDSIHKSNVEEFKFDEDKNYEEDDINWDNQSDHNLSNNHEEFKSYPNNMKSNNIDKSKNTENIHDM